MTSTTQGRRPTGPGNNEVLYNGSCEADPDREVTLYRDGTIEIIDYLNGMLMAVKVPDAVLHPPVADVSQLSDGYHTFAELYEHRHTLFAALMYAYAPLAFKTRRNQEGEEWPGWFIAGMDTPMGQLSYHMPDEWWDRLPDIREIERNDKYDGHTSADVLQRISWLRDFFQHPDPNPWAAVDAELTKPVAAPEPDWSQAPEWAMWTTVNATGLRQWWGNKMPWYSTLRATWISGEYPGKYATGGHVDLPLGVDWRTTLRSRPEVGDE